MTKITKKMTHLFIMSFLFTTLTTIGMEQLTRQLELKLNEADGAKTAFIVNNKRTLKFFNKPKNEPVILMDIKNLDKISPEVIYKELDEYGIIYGTNYGRSIKTPGIVIPASLLKPLKEGDIISRHEISKTTLYSFVVFKSIEAQSQKLEQKLDPQINSRMEALEKKPAIVPFLKHNEWTKDWLVAEKIITVTKNMSNSKLPKEIMQHGDKSYFATKTTEQTTNNSHPTTEESH